MAADFVAGCIGGCAGVAVGHPLDTVKVRIQTQDPKKPTYRGTLHCLQTIIQQESYRGLFKGMSSPMAGVDPDSLQSHAFAGAVAGFSQSVISSPMELVKTRIQIQGQVCPTGPLPYKGPMDCLGQIWRTEGVRGVFRGLGITVMREIPAFGVYFSSYEAMTRTQDSSQPISTMRMMAAGGFAGIFSWLFTYPIDMLKSRLQVDGLAGRPVYKGIGDCVLQTYRQESWNGIFRGMPSNLIRSFPVNATTFTVVTWIIRWTTPSMQETSVTYQETASLVQESLAATFASSQDRHHHVAQDPLEPLEWMGMKLFPQAPIHNYAAAAQLSNDDCRWIAPANWNGGSGAQSAPVRNRATDNTKAGPIIHEPRQQQHQEPEPTEKCDPAQCKVETQESTH